MIETICQIIILFGGKMNDDKKYWICEAYRHLALALIGSGKKQREHINLAIECLEKFEEENKK